MTSRETVKAHRCRFHVVDLDRNDMQVARCDATLEAVASLDGGEVLEGTEQDVAAEAIDERGATAALRPKGMTRTDRG